MIAGVYFVVMSYIGLKYHIVGDYNVETDFYWLYVPNAKEILGGHVLIEEFRGPAYPAFLAVVGVVLKDFFRSGIILSTLAASFVLFFAFETLKKLFRADLALVATTLTAVNATFVQYTYTAGTDMVFNALVAASAFFLFRKEERTKSDLVIFSVAAGVAYLTRYNGIFVVVAISIIFLLLNQHRLALREKFKNTTMTLGIFLATITPWGIYCLIEKGSFFYNRNYLNIAYEMFAKGKISWDQYWMVEASKFSSLPQVILADPALFAGTVVSNLYEHFVNDLRLLLGFHLGVFVVAGIFLYIKEKPTTRQLSYFTFGLCFFLVLLLVFYGERFSLFLIPVYASLALKALSWQRLSRLRFWNGVHAGAFVSWILITWSAADSITFNKANINSGPQEIPVIAETFRKNYGDSDRGKIILTRKPHIAYYLDMTMRTFPYVDNWEELKAEARSLHASYLFYGMMEAGLRPQFRELLDPRRAPEWLKPMTYTVSPPAVLYKVSLPGLE
ncbi:MAG: glycosyltransferase family 39 protein [Ignavibacteriales bacterium]|nr:glycosyltransferase family 39 protein [Ignavibacteriales bacterium]